jgi:hypothetical protein
MIRSVIRRNGMIAAAAFLGVSCAPLKDPWGLAVLEGRVPDAVAAPDSLQADLGIHPQEAGMLPFSARLYARPRHVYRLDAFGFPTAVVASYVWNEGRWMLVRHDKRQVWEGEGTQLRIEDLPLRLPDVHAVLGFLWGEPLPGFAARDSLSYSGVPAPEGVVRWNFQGEAWEARFDPRTGLCREARSASLTLRYARYQRMGARVLPGAVEVLVDGVPIMNLRLRGLDEAPKWKKNPFALSPPAAYERP